MDTKNACKACGLGMGGQRGARTNELGLFPSICRKSLQADSSDTQAAIPTEVFDHPLTELAGVMAKFSVNLTPMRSVT